MPFIAIAVALGLIIGGSAAAASPKGQVALESVSSALAHVEASIMSNTDAEVETHGELRVRGDATDEAKAADEAHNQAQVHADGSLEVHIF